MRCDGCRTALDPAQELRFLFESELADEPVRRATLGDLPADGAGEPLLVCQRCHDSIRANDAALRAARAAEERFDRRSAWATGGSIVAVTVAAFAWTVLGTVWNRLTR
jgi:hypothetical protein